MTVHWADAYLAHIGTHGTHGTDLADLHAPRELEPEHLYSVPF